MAGSFDLNAALGPPPSVGGAPAKPKAKTGGYLAGKDPGLVAYLRDAVDDTLSADERAEALCRAIEQSGAPAEVESDPDALVLEDDGEI